MAYYYNPYSLGGPVNYGQSFAPVVQQPQQQYMINVDGEAAAKSWQSPTVPQPNSIIPLFDLDGQHVYFKSFDAYGRMNPIRKGRIVFDDEIQQSETAAPAIPQPDLSNYVTKDDLSKMKEELLAEFKKPQNKNNQNGNNFRGDR